MNLTNLEVIVASRGRPKEAEMVRQSFYDTKTTGRVMLRFALDADDPTSSQYPKEARCFASHSITEALNLAFKNEASMHRYVGSICDEQRFITKGWDEAILDALDEMRGGVVYPNDLINPGTMPAMVAMSSAICRGVGYFAAPFLRVNYFDNVWKSLGEGVGRLRYLDDVAVQHLSMPHSEDNSLAIARDRETYIHWARWQMKEDVAKARAALAS